MKQLKNKILIAVATTAIVFSSCKKDKDLSPLPAPVNNPPELITSVHLIFTDSSNTSIVKTFKFRDPDGDGGNAPIQKDTIKLAANKSYSLAVKFWDETKTPNIDVTPDISAEANDHQVFFNFNGLVINHTYLDKDGNNNPVGLINKWRTKNIASGSANVILMHQVGVKNGSQSSGETDVNITLPILIQ